MNHFPLSLVNAREAVKDWCDEKANHFSFSGILQVLIVSSHNGAIHMVSQKAHWYLSSICQLILGNISRCTMKPQEMVSTLTWSGSLETSHFLFRQREDESFLRKDTVTNCCSKHKEVVGTRHNSQLLWTQNRI